MAEANRHHSPSPDDLPIRVQETVCRWLDRFGRLAPAWVHSMVSVAALVEKQGYLLTIARADGRGLALPGGLLRWRECVEDGLYREVLEETGLAVKPGGLFRVCSEPERDDRIGAISIVLLARIIGGCQRDSREGKVYWLDLRNPIPSMAFHDNVVVRQFLRHRWLIRNRRQNAR